jgi:hypothetical protein
MAIDIDKYLPKPRQRALGFFLLAVILVGNVVWFRGMLSPLFNYSIFGDVDLITILSLLGLLVLWRLKQKKM